MVITEQLLLLKNTTFDGITKGDSFTVWWEKRSLKENDQRNKRSCTIVRIIFLDTEITKNYDSAEKNDSESVRY